MALKIRIRDNKGVIVRYHKIKSFEVKDGKIEVTLWGYVNQAMRDSEKNAIENNAVLDSYKQETEELRSRVDSLSAELAGGNEDVKDEVVELSNQLNDRQLDPNRPQFQTIEDKHYNEDKTTIDLFEPLTFESIYEKLLADGKYVGAESV